MEINEWLNDELGQQIWENKYRYGNETFEQWLTRVSNMDTELMDMIVRKEFILGGRILANRGLEKLGKKVTYSNCYVLPKVEDSIEGIYKTASDLARTFSYGGGVGIDISNLRPKGFAVNNTAKETSGAVSFMDLYSQTTELIGQNGRRGALMISINISHPDIIDFIDIKTDLNKVTKANISVKVDDKFMTAVIDQETYPLEFEGEIIGHIDAKKVFMKLCENNWDYAEPGILFWDNINEHNILSEYIKQGLFEYAGVNPCLTGDTLVQTIEGKLPIKELVGKQPFVYCMDEEGKLTVEQASKVWLTRKNAELVEVDFGRGKIRCTPEHMIYTRNRGWVEAQYLEKGDKLNGLGFHKGNEIDEMVRLTTDKKYHRHHRFIMQAMGHDISNKDVHHKDGNHLNNKYSNLEVLNHGKHSQITNLGHECYAPRCSSTGKFVAKDTKSSVKSNGSVNKENTSKLFIVKSVTKLVTKEDVYDMTVPTHHNFIANDIVVHNCAEEPLPAGGSCLLGSINLDAFTEFDEALGTYIFNIPRLKECVRKSIRALNDVLDEGLALHPLQIQQDSVRDWRQIGLGIMGFADTLLHLGIAYGGHDCEELIHQIGKVISDTALSESAWIAKECGCFPKCDIPLILNSEFVLKNASNHTKELIAKYGLRNSQLLTIAPTGSISTMLGISGGIEPLFATSYTRKTESLHKEGDVYYTVYPPVMKDVLGEYVASLLGTENELPMPHYVVTSHDIHHIHRVWVQGAWQEYIDASISSTVNLPNNASVEDVVDAYIEAWYSGCKGLTVYRDGCKREGILTTGKKEEPKVEEVKEVPPYRADLAPDTVYYKRKIVTGCGKLKLFIGWSNSDNRIQDVYAVRSGQGGCEKNIQTVCILISELFRRGGNLDSIEKAFTGVSTCPSFVSAKAKGIPVSKGGYCGGAILNTLKEFINDTTKPMPLEVEEATEDKGHIKVPTVPCPECGTALQMTGGCNLCTNCGWSKCL